MIYILKNIQDAGLISEKKGIWKKTDNTEFFHDKDCNINDKDKLTERISGRIENFRKIIKDYKPIIFVQALKKEEDIENLYEVLKSIRGNKPFKLVILDFNDVVTKEYKNVSVLKIPFPSKKYGKYWDRKKYYESKEGKLFEETVTQQVKSEIDKFMKN